MTTAWCGPGRRAVGVAPPMLRCPSRRHRRGPSAALLALPTSAPAAAVALPARRCCLGWGLTPRTRPRRAAWPPTRALLLGRPSLRCSRVAAAQVALSTVPACLSSPCTTCPPTPCFPRLPAGPPPPLQPPAGGDAGGPGVGAWHARADQCSGRAALQRQLSGCGGKPTGSRMAFVRCPLVRQAQHTSPVQAARSSLPPQRRGRVRQQPAGRAGRATAAAPPGSPPPPCADGSVRGKGGAAYAKHAGLCLETQARCRAGGYCRAGSGLRRQAGSRAAADRHGSNCRAPLPPPRRRSPHCPLHPVTPPAGLPERNQPRQLPHRCPAGGPGQAAAELEPDAAGRTPPRRMGAAHRHPPTPAPCIPRPRCPLPAPLSGAAPWRGVPAHSGLRVLCDGAAGLRRSPTRTPTRRQLRSAAAPACQRWHGCRPAADCCCSACVKLVQPGHHLQPGAARASRGGLHKQRLQGGLTQRWCKQGALHAGSAGR